MKITAHMIVKNEENFVWYAIRSVIDFVDEIIVWDQESSDKTIELIKTIESPKIYFKKVTEEVHDLREIMLEETNADWIFILDGDEIWYEEGIKKLQSTINKLQDKKNCVVVPNYMLIGDIFHYQEELAGRYKIGEKKGHYNIRAVRKTLGLHVEGIYPNEAYVTKEGIKVQDLNRERVLFLKTPYLHASFLKRSSKDNKKLKYEIGEDFPKDFYYPEVFFKPRPNIVPSPWKGMNNGYKLKAMFETPLKKIKRRII
jgi:hypothetical protein